MKDELKIIDFLPGGFLEVSPKKMTKLIGVPTLISLKGEKDSPLFISIILHGNEFSGLIILQEILKKYQNRGLPQSLIIFVANPRACEQGLRHLKDQQDFNRIWKEGSFYDDFLTRPLLQYIKDQNIEYAIDIHNNSGRNPVYACITEKEEPFFSLAQLFSKNIVYFTQPDSVLSMALSKICPTVVIECGLPGSFEGISSGVRFIESLLDPEEQWKNHKIRKPFVYHTCATIHISSEALVEFRSPPILAENHHLCFIEQLEELNFKPLEKGTVLAKISHPQHIKLIDKKGQDAFHQFFSIVQKDLIVKSSFIPCMLTKDIQIAKNDCLGYVMQKISLDFEH